MVKCQPISDAVAPRKLISLLFLTKSCQEQRVGDKIARYRKARYDKASASMLFLLDHGMGRYRMIMYLGNRLASCQSRSNSKYGIMEQSN